MSADTREAILFWDGTLRVAAGTAPPTFGKAFSSSKEGNMDDDDTFYDADQPANDEDDADDDWGAWMLDNDTSVN